MSKKAVPPKSVLECFEELKPMQKDYLVGLAQSYMRQDFHKGLLPFLTIEDALRMLKRKREMVKAHYGVDVNSAHKTTGYLSRIINILSPHTNHVLHPDEESVTVMLTDWKLAQGFGRRYSKRFCIYLATSSLERDRSLKTAQLQQLGKNKWEITAHPNVIHDFIN